VFRYQVLFSGHHSSPQDLHTATLIHIPYTVHLKTSTALHIFIFPTQFTSRPPHRYTYSYSLHSSPQDFHTTTHIHIPYTVHLKTSTPLYIFIFPTQFTSRPPHRYTYSYSLHSSPQGSHTATHIHIPYTGSPQIRHITILPTDLHHIERIHTISKDLNITIPSTGIQYVGNIKGFTQFKKDCKKTYVTDGPIAVIVPFDCIYILLFLNQLNIVILTIDFTDVMILIFVSIYVKGRT
jgi:hypothetical protein